MEGIKPEQIEIERKKRLSEKHVKAINDLLIKKYDGKQVIIDHEEIDEIFVHDDQEHDFIDFAHLYVKEYYKDFGWDVEKINSNITNLYSLKFTSLTMNIANKFFK